MRGVELRSKKEREMARGVRALMHSLCAGRILLQSRNTLSHTHKHTAGALCLSERSPCRPNPETRGDISTNEDFS